MINNTETRSRSERRKSTIKMIATNCFSSFDFPKHTEFSAVEELQPDVKEEAAI